MNLLKQLLLYVITLFVMTFVLWHVCLEVGTIIGLHIISVQQFFGISWVVAVIVLTKYITKD